MAALIRKGEAPDGAIAPLPVDIKRLFALDVDEDIWQDLGLEDELDGEPAPWQVDPAVRSGIRYMLLVDRCEEEAARLAHERANMQEWVVAEWRAVALAFERAGEFLFGAPLNAASLYLYRERRPEISTHAAR